MSSRNPVLTGRISSLKDSVFSLSSTIQTHLKAAKSENNSKPKTADSGLFEIKAVLAELRLLGGALHSLQVLLQDVEDADNEITSANPSPRRQKVEWPLLDGCTILVTALEQLFRLVRPESLREAKEVIVAYRTKISFILGSSDTVEDVSLHFSVIPSEPLPIFTVNGFPLALPNVSRMLSNTDEDEASVETVSAWLKVLQSSEEDREPEEYFKEKSLVQSRSVATPEYREAASQWPKYAEVYYDKLRPQICSLFRIPRSYNLVQWVLEYVRETYPRIFGRSALSPTPLLGLTDALCDGSVSPLHIAAALGLHSLCRDLISMGADVKKNSLLGPPLFCALMGPKVFSTQTQPESWTSLLETDDATIDGQAATVSLLLDKKADSRYKFSWKDGGDASLAGLAFWVALNTKHDSILTRVVSGGAVLDDALYELLLRSTLGKLGCSHKKRFARLLIYIYDVALFVMHEPSEVLREPGKLESIEETLERIRNTIRELFKGHELELPTGKTPGMEFADGDGQVQSVRDDLVFRNFVQHAVLEPNTFLVRRLSLDPRFEPNMVPQNRAHSSLLHLATEGSHLEVMGILINAGASLETTDFRGRTPLMLVENTSALAMLVSHGAKTTASDVDGRTIWHYAAATNDDKLLKWLCEKDPCKAVNMFTTNKRTHTPLDEALLYIQSLVDVSKQPKKPSPKVLRMLLKEYDRLPPNSPQHLGFLIGWGELDLFQSFWKLAPQAFREKTKFLHNSINFSASVDLVDRLMEVAQGFVSNAGTGYTAAEAIFLNTELHHDSPGRFERSRFPSPTDHPSCHYELSGQVYGKLLTPEVLAYRNERGEGLWERFCQNVIPLADGPMGEVSEELGFLNRSIALAIKYLADQGATADYERQTGKSAIECIATAGGTSPPMWHRWKLPFIPSILEASQGSAIETFLKSREATYLVDQAFLHRSKDLLEMLIQRGAGMDDQKGWVGDQYKLQGLFINSATRRLLFKKLFEHVHPNTLFERFDHIFDLFRKYPEFLDLLRELVEKGLDLDWVPEGSDGAPTLLVRAVMINDTDLVSFYLDNGAQINHSGARGYTPLMAAAEFSSLNALNLLIKRLDKYEPSHWNDVYTDGEGTTWNPLQMAANKGNADVLDTLITETSLMNDIDRTTENNPSPPIHLAIRAESLRSVVVLQANEADLNVLDKAGFTPIQLARRLKLDKIVRFLVRSGAIDEPESFEHNEQAMQHEVENERSLRRGHRRIGFRLQKAISEFAAFGEAEELEIALEDFRPHEVRDAVLPCGDCTALSFATRRAEPRAALLLLKHGSGNLVTGCKYHWPVGFNAICSVFRYLQLVVDMPGEEKPNAVDGFERHLKTCLDTYLALEVPWLHLPCTPIHAVCRYKNDVGLSDISLSITVFDQLIDHLTKNADDYYWKFVVPLGLLSESELAARTSHLDRVGKVLYCAVNARLRENFMMRILYLPDGSTPLHTLIRVFHDNYRDDDNCRPFYEFVDRLLSVGADIDAQDDELSTPLHISVMNETAELATALLESGANPNLRDKSGATPLVIAATHSNTQIMDILIKHGADTTVFEDYGPLVMGPHVDTDTVDYLKKINLDFYQTNKGGWSLGAQLIAFDDLPKSYVLNGDFDFYKIAATGPNAIQILVRKISCTAHILKMVLKRFPEECRDRIINSGARPPQHVACTAIQHRDMGPLKTLIEFGLDLQRECSAAGTPLMYACNTGELEAVKMLVRHGARTEYTTKATNGVPVFRSAIDAAKLFPKIVRWLLVDRHQDQRRIGWTETSTFEAIKPWSGPRVAAYQFSGQNHEYGKLESETWEEFWKRLKITRSTLIGKTLPVKLLLDDDA